MSIGFDKMVNNFFIFKIFAGKLAKAIATDFADEVCVETASPSPHSTQMPIAWMCTTP